MTGAIVVTLITGMTRATRRSALRTSFDIRRKQLRNSRLAIRSDFDDGKGCRDSMGYPVNNGLRGCTDCVDCSEHPVGESMIADWSFSPARRTLPTSQTT